MVHSPRTLTDYLLPKFLVVLVELSIILATGVESVCGFEQCIASKSKQRASQKNGNAVHSCNLIGERFVEKVDYLLLQLLLHLLDRARSLLGDVRMGQQCVVGICSLFAQRG